MNKMAQFYLFQCRTTQPFRVAYGKSSWKNYEIGDTRTWNLREILNNEIVIEFDTEDKVKALQGIHQTGINLFNAGITFEVWDHGGKSPHLHIRNLPIGHLPKDKLREMKKLFLKEFVPKEYLDCVDFSLCGIHLIALEWTNHWKNKYGVKRLLHKFEPNGR